MLSSRFRIDEVLGMGGMGLVLAAQHLALDQRVALKLMRPEHREDPALVRRFLREARASARLRSPHAVRIFDVAVLEDGTPYIVMEFLDGTDVATLLRRGGAVPAPRAAAIVLQAGHAMAEAHALGIIHRDLKPSNLFMVRSPDDTLAVKVLDLGVCKLTSGVDELHTTASATTLGTHAYMAPEQRSAARDADERSDIWSLGVILHELVTGALPAREIAAMSAMNAPGVSPGFEAIVRRCLQPAPDERFQSAAELAAALAPFAAGASGDLRTAVRNGGLPVRAPWRRLALALALPVILAVVTLAVVTLAMRADRPGAPASAQRAGHQPPRAQPALAPAPDAPARSASAPAFGAEAPAACVAVERGPGTVAAASPPRAEVSARPSPPPARARRTPAPVDPLATPD